MIDGFMSTWGERLFIGAIASVIIAFLFLEAAKMFAEAIDLLAQTCSIIGLMAITLIVGLSIGIYLVKKGIV